MRYVWVILLSMLGGCSYLTVPGSNNTIMIMQTNSGNLSLQIPVSALPGVP